MISTSSLKPIVHIVTDEKFIHSIYKTYEYVFPGKNLVLALSKYGNKKFAGSTVPESYEIVDTTRDYISEVHTRVESARVIIFHGLVEEQALISNSLTHHPAKQVWSVFGFEVYNNPYIMPARIGQKTLKAIRFSATYLKTIARVPFYRINLFKKSPYLLIKEAIKNMDFVGVLYDEELELYRQLDIVKKSITLIRLSYYPLTVLIKEDLHVNGEHILVGNSASFSNNHPDAFDLISELDISGRKVVVPLSYGKKDYANTVVDYGKNKFGDQFHALREFLPIDEYYELMQSCGIVIMNHYRQQAVGNVLAALFMGARVYLSEQNTLYQYLRRIGCYVYSIEKELVLENSEALKRLDKDKVDKNREILSSELSLDRIAGELRKHLEPIL